MSRSIIHVLIFNALAATLAMAGAVGGHGSGGHVGGGHAGGGHTANGGHIGGSGPHTGGHLSRGAGHPGAVGGHVATAHSGIHVGPSHVPFGNGLTAGATAFAHSNAGHGISHDAHNVHHDFLIHNDFNRHHDFHHFHNGHVFFFGAGFGYPSYYYARYGSDYCDPYSPFYDPYSCYRIYGYPNYGSAGYSVPSSNYTPAATSSPVTSSPAAPPARAQDRQSDVRSIPDGTVLLAPLVSSTDAPEALPNEVSPGSSHDQPATNPR